MVHAKCRQVVLGITNIPPSHGSFRIVNCARLENPSSPQPHFVHAPPAFPNIYINQSIESDLVSSRMSLLLILLKPTLLLGRLFTGNSLTLNFDGLGLVSLQIAGKAGLFGGWRRFGSGEFLDVGFGLAGFGGLGLVGAEFAEVEVLDGVGC